MTTAVFYENTEKMFEKVIVKGHSGYAESGSDIICASVSSMMNLFIRFLDESHISYNASADGSVPETVVSIEKGESAANTAFRAFYKECECLAEEFPKYVKVIKRKIESN